MVRKRGPLDRIERIMSKKRRVNSTSDATPPMNEDKNLLNNRMLSLYKEDIAVKVKAPNTAVKDKAPLLENEGILNEMNVFENTKKTPKPECSKITTKVADTSVKKKSSVLTLEHSSITFDDVAGLDELLDELLESFNHIIDHQLFTRLGIQPVRGLLLHGPPGCGKTHLAQALAGELGLPYIEVAATELVDGISGESESNIRDIFDEAVKSSPCILFIDEIDAVSPKRETTEKGMEKRMVNQFLKCFDELNKKDAQVMVIGATNKPDFMDPALRRGGRFEEIAIGMPDETARLKILHVMCKNLKFAPDFDMQWLARHTPGYAGADLKSLITQAVKVGLRRFYKKLMSSYFSAAQTSNSLPNIRLPDFGLGPDSGLGGLVRFRFRSKQKTPEEEYENIIFELQDFQVALRKCVPCSKREGFADVPNATWDDVGALNDVKKQLQAAILWPVRYRELYESLNYSTPKGYLLYGPKGCGKTLLAKAIANECSINFLSVKGPEFLSMYVGESEKAVRQCFQRAKSSAPCVIFFDEIDAICSNRSDANLNPAADRVVTQLLTEMDGIEDRKEVFVVAATNRLEKIDAAMLRPGRLEKIIYVDVPNSDGRVEILKRITKNKTRPKIADDVDLELIGQDYRCENFSGADLAHLVREATTKVLDDCINSEHVSSKELAEINFEHFQHAFTVVKPSITEADRKYYRSLVRRYM